MNNIALYNTLRKIPEVSDKEAKEAIADVANSKEVATKADIKDMATKADLEIGLAKQEGSIKEAIAKQEAQLTWRMVVIGLAIVGIIKYL